MTDKNNGGPAFPSIGERCMSLQNEGMTLRDYFAAKAMQAIVTSSQYECGGRLCAPENLECVADDAYAMADAMLKAREL